jgi:hypothetical protein
MAATPFFNVTEQLDGIIYYIIPAGTRLFRGDIPPNYNRPLDHITGPVFFGETANGVLQYGIPFEFVTNSEIRLLALDKSMKQIYDNALADHEPLIDGEPAKEVIPSILNRNYGYSSGIRNSANAADTILAKYICEKYSGYATNFMTTDANGKFHREIVICDKNKVEFVKKLTEVNGETVHENAIIEEQNLRKVAQQVADARKEAKEEARKRKAEEEGLYDNGLPPSYAKKLSLGDFGDSDEEGGPGKKFEGGPVKKLFGFDGGKSSKRTKSHKKQMRNKRRKTHKKGKPKKATRKRK